MIPLSNKPLELYE